VTEVDEVSRMRYFDEVGELCLRWRDEGMSGSQVLAELFTIVMSVCEGSNLTADEVCDLVRSFYRHETKRPVAKA
jgi:hypothetical protein